MIQQIQPSSINHSYWSKLQVVRPAKPSGTLINGIRSEDKSIINAEQCYVESFGLFGCRGSILSHKCALLCQDFHRIVVDVKHLACWALGERPVLCLMTDQCRLNWIKEWLCVWASQRYSDSEKRNRGWERMREHLWEHMGCMSKLRQSSKAI